MTDTIPKSEVARVLAEEWDRASRARFGYRQAQPFLAFNHVITALNLRPEFESALAAMEQKEKK